MKKVSLSLLIILVGGLAFANEGKALFLAQQASGEVQRLSQQLSEIQETQDALSLRLGKHLVHRQLLVQIQVFILHI